MSNEKSIQKAQVHLEQLPALRLVDDERVHNKFVSIFNTVHGRQAGEQTYEVEKFHFTKQLTENPALQECTKLSLYGVFIDVGVQGLSFDPTKKLCYIIPYNVNAGTKDNPKWEKRASLNISPYGELYLRQMNGQIRSAENPEVVYAGEEFSVTSGPNGKGVTHSWKYPRPEGDIVACYFKFIKADGTVDYGFMDLRDMERLKAFSAKKNNGKANALYGENGKVDKGFLIAKTIKHAFKAYPKVKLKGQFSQLETEQDEQQDIDYGFDASEIAINKTSVETAQMTMPPASDRQEEPVTIESADYTDF